MLRSAHEWGVPPLVILRGHKQRRKWTQTDRVLAIAFTLSKNLVCPGCGQPKHEAWNPDSEGYYAIKDADCQACAELERDSKAHKDHEPARKVWPVSTHGPDDPPFKPWQP